MSAPNRVEDLLILLEETILVSPADELQGASVHTFALAGLLKQNQGMVLHLANGAEFRITVVQTRKADTNG